MRCWNERKWLKAVVAIVAASELSLAGCGGSAAGGGDNFKVQQQLNTVASFYGDYLSEHGGAPPQDEAAFRAFLQERAQGIERMDVGGVDGLLTSPRDGQLFVVIYGKRLAPADSPNTPWAAYEQTGVDGKRFAAQVRGDVVELTDAEIASQITAPPR
jgi:hypothetical protein